MDTPPRLLREETVHGGMASNALQVGLSLGRPHRDPRDRQRAPRFGCIAAPPVGVGAPAPAGALGAAATEAAAGRCPGPPPPAPLPSGRWLAPAPPRPAFPPIACLLPATPRSRCVRERCRLATRRVVRRRAPRHSLSAPGAVAAAAAPERLERQAPSRCWAGGQAVGSGEGLPSRGSGSSGSGAAL